MDGDRAPGAADTGLPAAGAVPVMLLGLAPGRIWVLYAALIAENAGVVLNMPAWQARTPAIVGTGSLLSSANALNSVSSGTVRLIGGPFGVMSLVVPQTTMQRVIPNAVLGRIAALARLIVPQISVPSARTRPSPGTPAGAAPARD